jgi:hypothetical protein
MPDVVIFFDELPHAATGRLLKQNYAKSIKIALGQRPEVRAAQTRTAWPRCASDQAEAQKLRAAAIPNPILKGFQYRRGPTSEGSRLSCVGKALYLGANQTGRSNLNKS